MGGGGREHALCWRLAQSPNVERIWSAPGNAGIAGLATLVPVAAGDVSGIVEFAECERIDLTVVGPEAPLVAGLADELEARGLAVFGPARDAARLEGSKAWARSLCADHGIPAPASRVFREIEPAMAYLETFDAPYVVKADGLAQGKGVIIAEDREEARRALEACLVTRTFGDAGARVLVEEYLEGFEVSALALADGTTMVPLALAHDYKRALDGDLGPNTGGMGAFSPVPQVGPEAEWEIVSTVLHATARALESEGIRYRGVVYAGLMLTAEGPKVLEFNARFGTPRPRSSSSGCRPTWRRSCSPARRASSSRRTWPGRRMPPWAWSWPRAATRASTGRALRSPDWRTRGRSREFRSSTRGRLPGTVELSRPEGGCCP